MAKKEEKHEGRKEMHYCGDCGCGEWIAAKTNMDIFGYPICVKCDVRNENMPRGCSACKNWKPKSVGEIVITPERRECSCEQLAELNGKM